jgi:hypothetical protein
LQEVKKEPELKSEHFDVCLSADELGMICRHVLSVRSCYGFFPDNIYLRDNGDSLTIVTL